MTSGSQNSSTASVAFDEILQIIAPSFPAWNQCQVLGGQICWYPGANTTSFHTVQYCLLAPGGKAAGFAVAGPGPGHTCNSIEQDHVEQLVAGGGASSACAGRRQRQPHKRRPALATRRPERRGSICVASYWREGRVAPRHNTLGTPGPIRTAVVGVLPGSRWGRVRGGTVRAPASLFGVGTDRLSNTHLLQARRCEPAREEAGTCIHMTSQSAARLPLPPSARSR